VSDPLHAKPSAVYAKEVLPRPMRPNPPAPFAKSAPGKVKRALGDQFGLRNFGVNHVTLAPGARSSLHHQHSGQDEFIYVLAGTLMLVTDTGETRLEVGMCAGFAAGQGAHHLENRSDRDVIYLEVGDRTPNDHVTYPHDDIVAISGSDGQYRYTHKDGRPY